MVKDYFKSSLIYYYQDLIKKGNSDPLRVVIADLLDTIDVSDNQKDYLKKYTNNDKKDIDNIIILLNKMDITNKVDHKALKIIINKLEHLKGEA